MTDADIVRHLAEFCGWDREFCGPDRGRAVPDYAKPAFCAHGVKSWADTICRGHCGDSYLWNPLTDARATEQVMEALEAKGYQIVTGSGLGLPWATIYPLMGDDGPVVTKHEPSRKRAFCLAVVRATGGVK